MQEFFLSNANMFAFEGSRLSRAAARDTPRLIGARARSARFRVFLRKQSSLKNKLKRIKSSFSCTFHLVTEQSARPSALW